LSYLHLAVDRVNKISSWGGIASHFDKQYTLQRKLHKFINIKIFKKLLEWGFEESAIMEALG
jgi:hypothetical protein